MFMKYAGALGQSMISVFSPEKSETPLVKLFRVEYQREYQYARKHGAVVNDYYVNEFIKNQKAGT